MCNRITTLLQNYIPYYHLQIKEEPLQVRYADENGDLTQIYTYTPTKKQYVINKLCGLAIQLISTAMLGIVPYAVKEEYELQGRMTFANVFLGTICTIGAICMFNIGHVIRRDAENIFKDRIIKKV